ncbi:hypothetical protein GUJ93_ZPchr0009g762 [Zizania palustris]|uniref:Uncharacterized protein n=1 Tax=Zizania palustris TaxID=103762 RepID=A0A8J5RHE0_ZIZPA|nr:hypothetical protein GUJ93_ZPchr0009g762 [Zizania palustris]
MLRSAAPEAGEAALLALLNFAPLPTVNLLTLAALTPASSPLLFRPWGVGRQLCLSYGSSNGGVGSAEARGAAAAAGSSGRQFLSECAASHLRHKGVRAEHGSRLQSSGGRMLLQSLPGTKLCRERLVRALAHELQVPILVMDSSVLAPYDYGDDYSESDPESSEEEKRPYQKEIGSSMLDPRQPLKHIRDLRTRPDLRQEGRRRPSSRRRERRGRATTTSRPCCRPTTASHYAVYNLDIVRGDHCKEEQDIPHLLVSHDSMLGYGGLSIWR